MKKILILLIILIPSILEAQDSERFISKGLCSGKGTLAVGLPTTYKGTNMYVSGNLEYYLENNISFRGGIWMFLGTSGAEDVLAKNSTLFTGFYYHFRTNNNIDPYIGLEPGLSWTQLKKPVDINSQPFPYNMSTYPQSLSPVTSIATGLNYYATNWVHLFVEAKYIHGIHASDVPAISLSEFRIAFGFGFNFWTKKKKS